MHFISRDNKVTVTVSKHPWEPGLYNYLAVVDGNMYRRELNRMEYERTVHELRSQMIQYQP